MGLRMLPPLIVQLVGALASSDPETAPVLGVLTRVVGAKTASIFELKLDTSMEQGFSLAPASAEELESGVVVTVTASGLPELSYGAGYYLRTHAGMSFACIVLVAIKSRKLSSQHPRDRMFRALLCASLEADEQRPLDLAVRLQTAFLRRNQRRSRRRSNGATIKMSARRATRCGGTRGRTGSGT